MRPPPWRRCNASRFRDGIWRRRVGAHSSSVARHVGWARTTPGWLPRPSRSMRTSWEPTEERLSVWGLDTCAIDEARSHYASVCLPENGSTPQESSAGPISSGIGRCRSLLHQSCRVHDGHRSNLVGRESCVEEPLHEHRETVGHRRIDRLAEIGRDHAPRHAGFAMLANATSHGALLVLVRLQHEAFQAANRTRPRGPSMRRR
jgi:hypothetical protein